MDPAAGILVLVTSTRTCHSPGLLILPFDQLQTLATAPLLGFKSMTHRQHGLLSLQLWFYDLNW